MASFEKERLAGKFCEQYGILDDDERRKDVISAFCVGYEFGSEKVACKEKDEYEEYEIFKKQKEYYEKKCIVRHWKQLTMESGEFVESEMRVCDAIYQIKECWLERATFELI